MTSSVEGRKLAVHVVDDDSAVLEALSELLSEKGFSTRCYSSAEELLGMCPLVRPCCLLLDEQLSGMSGSSLLNVLKMRGFDSPIIFISAYADAPLAVSALKSGAINVLPKPVKADDLLKSLREASLEEENRLRECEEFMRLKGLFETLSKGEKDVMCSVVEGHSNKVIASNLGVSMRTVELRRHNVFEKLKVEGVADLVKVYVEYGRLSRRRT